MWQMEEQNIDEVPAHTGDGVDAGGSDENDEPRLVLHSDNIGRLGQKQRRTTTQNWPKPGQHARTRTNKPRTPSAKQQGKANDH